MAQIHETDFNMKPSVDISGIAQVLQRKKIAEMEAKQAQRAQKMQELSQTIGLATNLATTMVESSKQRQKAAFVQSLSESMASQVPMKTQSFANPMQLSSHVPAMSGIGSPDLPKMDLMRDATRVAPEKAAEHAFKLANPNLNADQSLSFQRMTFKGSDGKSRTVNVGVLGTTLVNPVTKQPFQGTPQEVDSMPEYGFVEREEYAGTDNEGNPVFRNPVEGTAYTKDAKGNPVSYSGPIMPKLQNPGEGTVNKLQYISETRDILNEAIKNFDGAFVGPVAGRVAPIKEWLSATTNETQSAFNQFLAEVDSIKRHELYGSALSVGEQSFFNQISLDTKVSPEAFLARLKAAQRKLNIKEKSLHKAAKQSGKVIRNVSPESHAVEGYEGFTYTVDEE